MCNEYNPKNIGYFYGTAKDTGPSYVYYPAEMWGYYCLNPQFENPETGKCKDLFAEENKAFTCNPNTNKPEYRPEFIFNPDYEINGEPPIGCTDGKEFGTTYYAVGSNSDGSEYIPYSEYTCSDPKEPDNSGGGTGDGGSNDGDTGTPTPTITTNPDGSKSWTLPDGTNLNLTTNGTLTTTYPDGSLTVSQVGTNYDPTTGSTGGSGGSGSTGNTTNETNPNTNDTPVDDTPAANSCTDGSLTLQEKMLCEMNAGMKKLNSEFNTENSLNNLLKDLNKTSNTNATAINTNIIETNKKLDSVKALNENLLKEQKRTNEYLVDVENSVSTSNVLLQNVVGAFTNNNSETFENSLEGSGNLIDSFTGQYTTFYNNMLTQKDTLESLFNNTQNTINQGFSFSLDNKEITSCPLVYDLDFSSVGMNHHIPLNVDLCLYSSYIKPIMYPIFLIFLSIGTTFLAFNIIIRLI